ncbi:hypothetical protein [Dickeya dadantii]|uniref:hypothetical protein n=1 Tax=Dickeya dadantii TaxID=204038 RepID=UPI0013923869|nr:hypothetical protein [Dickeya dadantii]
MARHQANRVNPQVKRKRSLNAPFLLQKLIINRINKKHKCFYAILYNNISNYTDMIEVVKFGSSIPSGTVFIYSINNVGREWGFSV